MNMTRLVQLTLDLNAFPAIRLPNVDSISVNVVFFVGANTVLCNTKKNISISATESTIIHLDDFFNDQLINYFKNESNQSRIITVRVDCSSSSFAATRIGGESWCYRNTYRTNAGFIQNRYNPCCNIHVC
jgi:hypothetical protein